MPDLEQAAMESREKSHAEVRHFMRFTRAQRYLHAALFTSFLGLAGTGLPLRFSESIWARGLAKAVGGFGAILFFHKFCALVLTRGLSHSPEGDSNSRYHPSRKGHLLGSNLDGGQLEGC